MQVLADQSETPRSRNERGLHVKLNKRPAALAMALAGAMLLSACGGGDQPPAQTQAPTTAAQQAPAGVAPAPTPAEAAPVPVDQLLKSASLAVAEERLVAPAGNNAVEYYLAVTTQEPSNVQATQALVDIFPLAATSAEREIAQKNVAEAERIVVAPADGGDPVEIPLALVRKGHLVEER